MTSISLNKQNNISFQARKESQAQVNNRFIQKTALGAATGAIAGGLIGSLGGPIGAGLGAEVGAGIAAIQDASQRSKTHNPKDHSKKNTLLMAGFGVLGALSDLYIAKHPETFRNCLKSIKEMPKVEIPVMLTDNKLLIKFTESMAKLVEKHSQKTLNSPLFKFLSNASDKKIRNTYIALAALAPLGIVGFGAICSATVKGIKSLFHKEK